jgi:hypothetical protein
MRQRGMVRHPGLPLPIHKESRSFVALANSQGAMFWRGLSFGPAVLYLGKE